MNIERIDVSRLKTLIDEANKDNDFSNSELGEYVSVICQKVLARDCFSGYTEDWKMEMFGEACLAVYKSMSTANTESDSLFNYLYTCAINSCKKTIQKLQDIPTPIDEAMCSSGEPFYVRNKRRITKGLLKKNEEVIVEAAKTKKRPLLKNVIGRAARAFAETLKNNQLKELLEIARKNREALC